MNTSGLKKNEDAYQLSTAKPQKNIPVKVPDGFPKKDGIQSRVDSGNRMGRHFRNNNSRLQSVTEKPVQANLSSSTTKKPFRVYYFEPKRKKSKAKSKNSFFLCIRKGFPFWFRIIFETSMGMLIAWREN